MNKKIFLFSFILLAGFTFANNLQAAKILGVFGDKDYDLSFLGMPVSAHPMALSEQVDAIEAPQEAGPRDIVVFKIERVMVGEFPKVKRGGPSRFDQAQAAFKEKKVLDVLGFNFKNPNDEIDREMFKVAVKNSGETFGITVGQPLEYFQHKIYLKKISKKTQTYQFVKSQPVVKKA